MSQAPIVPPDPKESNFVRILPPAGMKSAVCCDVVYRGKKFDQKWDKEKEEVSIHWMLTETIPTDVWIDPKGNEVPVPELLAGKQFIVSEWYTFSLGEKANLRRDLNAWRGKALTDEEAAAFNLQNLVGVRCVLTIGYNEGRNGKTYANVNAVAPLQLPFEPVTIDPDYKRIADRPPREGQQATSSTEPMQPATAGGPPPDLSAPDDAHFKDDDLPF